jgi:hypothetical protein
MVEKVITVGPNVIDFARYQLDRAAGKLASFKAAAISVRTCRHCNAALAEGENEDECSGALGTASALNTATPRIRSGPRKFYAE